MLTGVERGPEDVTSLLTPNFNLCKRVTNPYHKPLKRGNDIVIVSNSSKSVSIPICKLLSVCLVMNSHVYTTQATPSLVRKRN